MQALSLTKVIIMSCLPGLNLILTTNLIVILTLIVGEHHVFQGCPASQGWSHSTSKDLVHWEDKGRGVHMIHETYAGMDSTSCGPCSGFVTVDDEGLRLSPNPNANPNSSHNLELKRVDKGTPCAGFRQCGSTKGATGLNPQASLEVPIILHLTLSLTLCRPTLGMCQWSSDVPQNQISRNGEIRFGSTHPISTVHCLATRLGHGKT